VTGVSYDQFRTKQVDAGFICGLPYVRLAGEVHALAAPVVDGARYCGRPVYFSDVVVRRGHPARSFDDLRGASWCYNEPNSHSGYLTVLHHLARRGESTAFFGRFDAVGFHTTSMRLVADGSYDASAIDSHVLALTDHPDLEVIDSIGPSPIQPVVAADHVPSRIREAMTETLLSMHVEAPEPLRRAMVARYVAVGDADYDPIRAATRIVG